MASIPYIANGERVVGSGHAVYPDTLNRAMLALLNQSGYPANPAGTPGILGPAHNAKGYGAKGTGLSADGDDGAKIQLAHDAAVADGGEFVLTNGTYYCSTSRTFTAPVTVRRGVVIKPSNGVTITFKGAIHAGQFAWIDLSLGGNVVFAGSTPIIEVAWYLEVTTNGWNTPQPATPTVWDGTSSSHGLSQYSGSGGMTAGHTFKASTTRTSVDIAGVTRETGPSPLSATYTAINECSFGIIPEDPGCGLEGSETGVAVGWSAYLRDLADGIDHRSEYSQAGSSDGYTRGYLFGWADMPDYLGCAFGAYTSGGQAPPAAGTLGACATANGTNVTGVVASGDATITVGNTGNFAAAGYAQCGTEIFQYTGKTGTTFTGCTRGALASTAAAHAIGDGVTAVALVQVPTVAPTLVPLGALLRNTQYDVQISYTYGDGTEGPLSGVGSATIGNNAGGYLIVFLGEAPPHGAHFVNLYAAKHLDTMRRISQRPVGSVALELHDIPSASDTPARDPTLAYFDPWTRASAVHPTYPGQGACLSTISPINLAVRSARESGGAIGVRVPAGTNFYKSPLVLDPNPTYQNSLGETGFSSGLRLFAEGGLNGFTEVRYTGPLIGTTGIVNTYPRLVIENVRFTEVPGTGHLRYGLRFADYAGGGSFFCRLVNSAFDAEALHGIGIIGDSASGGTNSHTCSELMIMGGFVGGRRGPLYFAGPQTGNIHLTELVQLQSGADTGAGPGGATSAHSFCIRHACSNAVLTCEVPWMDGGQYKVYLTDTWTREGGGSPVFYGRSLGGESHGTNGGAFGIYCSSIDSGQHTPSIRLTGECGFQGPNEHVFYDIYASSRARISSINNVWHNYIVLDHIFADLKHTGGTMTQPLLRTTRFYGGGQAPSAAYPSTFDRTTDVQADVLQLVPLLGGAADVTTAPNTSYIEVDCTAAARAVRIPSAKYRPGHMIIIKKIDTSANAVNIDSLGDQSNLGRTIDGNDVSPRATIPGGSAGGLILVSNGTEWKKVAKI